MKFLFVVLLFACGACGDRSFRLPRFQGYPNLLKCLNEDISVEQSNERFFYVETIQKALADLGLLSGTVDGYFGPETIHAVAKFQTDYMLFPSGVVDARTMKALDDSPQLCASDMSFKLPASASEYAEMKKKIISFPFDFCDRGLHVVVMKHPEPYAVRKKPIPRTFTESAVGENKDNPNYTVINGPLFEGILFSKLPPYITQGKVIEKGKVLPHGKSSPKTFFFAWTKNGSYEPPPLSNTFDDWKFGLGDPPSDADMASGGGIPVIINGLSYGETNVYTDNAPSDCVKAGEPTPICIEHLLQRSSAGFKSFEEKEEGKVVMGISFNYFIIIVEADSTKPGMLLSEIRDSLISMNVTNALEWDGSNSATLVRNAEVVVRPASEKDIAIVSGIGFK